jgi:hypothetical protein
MQPVRKVISATHFKRVTLPENPDAIKWTPCSPGDPDAVEKSWSEVESDELLEPPLKLKDFLKSLDSVRPTVTEADIKRHDDWTKESGTSLQLSFFKTYDPVIHCFPRFPCSITLRYRQRRRIISVDPPYIYIFWLLCRLPLGCNIF